MTARLAISAAADQWIDKLGADLELGAVELWQLPGSLAQLYWFGYHAGERAAHAPCEARIADLERQADMWHFCYANRTPPGGWLRAQSARLRQEDLS